MRQLCSGLDFIHARGFIHRDIKSGNIFIGPDGLATILDFGILRSSENAEALTRTGMVMGTPQYMSPEQALGAKEIDHRADLYALAVLLFECLTGTLPFEAESELSLIQMQAHAPPPDLIDRAPWVPKPVAEVVKRALGKRPEDRYSSAGELLLALEDAYGGKTPAPVTGPRPWASPPVAGSSPQGGPILTQPSLKRLGGEAFGPSPESAMPDRAAANRGRSLPGSNSVRGAAAAVEPGPAGEQAGPDTSELARYARRGRAPKFVAAGAVVVVLVLAGYVGLGRSRSQSSALARVAGAQQTRPPSGGDASDAGLDLKEGQKAEGGSDAGATLASARVAAGDGDGADRGSENGADQTSQAASEDSPIRSDAKHLATRKPAARANGTLNLITTLGGEPFWASAMVDGVRRGNTPLLLDLPPGKHRIRLERTGFQPVNKQIKIASGRARVLRIELIP